MKTVTPTDDEPLNLFHEVWWIFSLGRGPNGLGEPWGGLRIGHFHKTVDFTEVVFINGETDRRRIGMRIWDDIAEREGWVKVAKIAVPSDDDIKHALDARLHEIARQISDDVMNAHLPDESDKQ
jgi:hypothetical protein